MPRQVEIEVFQIARTHVDVCEVERWLRFLGADEFFEEQFEKFYHEDGSLNERAHLSDRKPCSDGALLVALAAKRCYKSFQVGMNPNITKVRKDLCEYLDNILKSGHGSVLEHAVYSFAIENVSRVFTGEMNRHRAGWAISEGSMRYIRYDEIPYWLPTSLQLIDEGDEDLENKKMTSQIIFNQVFSQIEEAYKKLCDVWNMDESDNCNINFHYKKKITSCLRRIIPMGVATGGIWTGNLRALRHVIALRTDESAEEEIFHVFSKIAEIMLKEENFLFKDFERDDKTGSYVPKYGKV